MCFGRYDSPEHKVVDFPPSTWPGKDYYNPRYFCYSDFFIRSHACILYINLLACVFILLLLFVRESEPNSWEDTMTDELDRTKYPRMPWHDVQCALYGPACRDIARHFVQRWNYAKVSWLSKYFSSV